MHIRRSVMNIIKIFSIGVLVVCSCIYGTEHTHKKVRLLVIPQQSRQPKTAINVQTMERTQATLIEILKHYKHTYQAHVGQHGALNQQQRAALHIHYRQATGLILKSFDPTRSKPEQFVGQLRKHALVRAAWMIGLHESNTD